MMEAHELVDALRGVSTTTPPKVSTECPHFVKPTPKEWCATCSGIGEDSPNIPRIHDGRHGRACGRCRQNQRNDIENSRLKPWR